MLRSGADAPGSLEVCLGPVLCLLGLPSCLYLVCLHLWVFYGSWYPSIWSVCSGHIRWSGESGLVPCCLCSSLTLLFPADFLSLFAGLFSVVWTFPFSFQFFPSPPEVLPSPMLTTSFLCLAAGAWTNHCCSLLCRKKSRGITGF